MKRLAAVFAVIILLAGAAEAASVGNPFLKRVTMPSELASKIEGSLAKDQSGKSKIDPQRCNRDGSCATPENYLVMFQESDPDALLVGVGQLPGYLRALEVVPAPIGEYWLACLKPQGKGKYKPVLHCLSRRFKPGETAWVNAKTRKVILASDCTNPVEKEVPRKCVEIHFFTKPGDTAVRFCLIGPNAVADDCIGVKKAGAEEFQTWWTDECASADCNFSGASSVVGQPVQLAGSYVPEPGEHILRLPAFMAAETLFRTVLCLDRSGEHSDGMGVQWFDYVHSVEPARATVWYDKVEVPQGAANLYWPWGDWFGQ